MSKKKGRKISYQWRLFLPMVITLWVLLIGISSWQFMREREYRRNYVQTQLELINKRLVRSIEHNNWNAIDTFLFYIGDFYDAHKLFADVRVSIYDRDWNVKKHLGRPINLDPDEAQRVANELIERKTTASDNKELENRESFYLGATDKDGEYTVITALPNGRELSDALTGEQAEVWIVIFIVALIITVVCYLSARYLAKNINILREFANRSANDPWFIPGTDFPHDELGDIARRIVQMYNERATAREHIEREHRMALHAIEEKARQKRQLTNNINHELKTPIGVIKGYLDTILETPDMDDETRTHFISKACEHANRLVDLIADISAITRLEEGSQQMNTEQLDFHEVVYIFMNDVRESGVLGKFSLEFDIPIGLEISGNNNLLIGLLLNLTKNAVNYSQGDHIKIEYRGEDDKFYTFAFYDNGTGVPESSIEHLFDRFYRIDSGRARKSGGTGLGLAIVYNTIRAHGGTIIARNRKNGGLEFEFTLPKWQPD